MESGIVLVPTRVETKPGGVSWVPEVGIGKDGIPKLFVNGVAMVTQELRPTTRAGEVSTVDVSTVCNLIPTERVERYVEKGKTAEVVAEEEPETPLPPGARRVTEEEGIAYQLLAAIEKLPEDTPDRRTMLQYTEWITETLEQNANRAAGFPEKEEPGREC